MKDRGEADKSPKAVTVDASVAANAPAGTWRSVGVPAALGAALVWVAQPPLAWSWIAWVALIPWAWLAARPGPPRRRGYLWIWAAGSLLWLTTVQGVRLAHPALYPGWIVLGIYLGVFPPLAVGLTRVMHHGWRVPLWLALPAVWTGLELIRSYAFTGFSIALLGHSQADVPLMLQIADTFGTYGVSFVLATVAGTATVMLRWWAGRCSDSATPVRWPVVGSVVAPLLVAATLAYGHWRLEQADRLAAEPPLLEALLIQRNEPLVYSMDANRETTVFSDYVDSTLAAIRQYPQADVVVWPESMFTGGLPLRVLGETWTVPPEMEMSREEFEAAIEDQRSMFLRRAAEVQRMAALAASRQRPPELLVGSSVYRYADHPQAFGGAVHIDADHQVTAWYGKMHLVMFGEYIPFGSYFPWLYEVGPLRQGATPGDRPVQMQVAGTSVAPSICFETMVEHVTGNGLRRLAARGETPELIINITNDAWFHGASILDHHRRCSQLIAVANRRPLLMAANQGPTVWIDGSGRRVESLPHEVDRPLLARPTPDGRWSVYRAVGDKLVWPLGLLCGVLAISGYRTARRKYINLEPQGARRGPNPDSAREPARR